MPRDEMTPYWRRRSRDLKELTYSVPSVLIGSGTTLERLQLLKRKVNEVKKKSLDSELLLVLERIGPEEEGCQVSFWFREAVVKVLVKKQDVKSFLSRAQTMFPQSKFEMGPRDGKIYLALNVRMCEDCSAPMVSYFLDEEAALFRCINCGNVGGVI